ncbi:kinase-like domain-containing protein [Aspergillus californicus]
MEVFLSTSLVDWRLETRFDGNGDRYHRVSDGDECWRPIKRLGNGTFGDVWQEHCLSGSKNNTLRAVKQIRRHQEGFDKLSKRELDALVAFSNPDVPEYRDHFVQCLGWFNDNYYLYIAMEYIHFGDLQQYVTCRTFPESEAASIALQVAQALRYMHESSFVHRDLKPLNILVAEPGPRWHVKLADFGLAKSMDGTVLATQAIGTRGYMAPELVEESTTEYTPAVDIWALGAVVFCMRTCSPPFLSTRQLIEYVYRNNTRLITGPLGLSSRYCVDFVLRAMDVEAPARLTIDQVLAHDWLSVHPDVEHQRYIAESSMSTNSWAQVDSNAWSSTISSGSAATQQGLGLLSPHHPSISPSLSISSPGSELLPYGTVRPQPEETDLPVPQVFDAHITSAPSFTAGLASPGDSRASRYGVQHERAKIAEEKADKGDNVLMERLVLEFGYTEEEAEAILNKHKKDKHSKRIGEKKTDSYGVNANDPTYPELPHPNQLRTALPLRTAATTTRKAQYTPSPDLTTPVPAAADPVLSVRGPRYHSKDISKQVASSDTGDDPYLTCPDCKESFHFHSDLLKHLKKKQHARDPVTKQWRKRPEQSSKVYQKRAKCPECDETFNCSDCQSNHLRDSGHGQDTRGFLPTCRTCDETFYCQDDLFSHIKASDHARSSRDSVRTCRICNEAFHCFDCLSNHLKASGHGWEVS